MLDIEECYIDEGCGLDTVITIAVSIAIVALHLSSVGVGSDRGVTFPSVRGHQITCTIGAVRIHQIHVNQLLAGIVLIVVVQSRCH